MKKKKKPFDCVEMKNKIQQKMIEKLPKNFTTKNFFSLQKTLAKMQKKGRAIAKKMKIKPKDIEGIIDEGRK